jgi:hypothetical protein
MNTREKILDNKFKERGILKAWVGEVKQAVLDAMEEYAQIKNEPTEYPQYTNDGKIDDENLI